MKDTLLTTFPKSVIQYNGYYMFHIGKDLNVITDKYTGCRETFCASIRHKHNSTITSDNYSEINTNRLYVLITFGGNTLKAAIASSMVKSLKIVNSFERYYKWPLSKIRPVNDKRLSVDVPSILFVGNRKWGISPYLVSLYTLLVRLGKYPWLTDTIANETDHEKLVGKLKRVCSTKRDAFRDAMHIHRSIDMANILMHNYDELFKGKSKKYHWGTDKLGGGGYNEGIRLLAEGKTDYKDLHKKCKELGKK